MNESINLISIEDIPLIKTGDDLPSIIFNALKHNNLTLENGDILVITQAIVSKSLGRIKNLVDIKTSQKAIEIYEKMTPLTRKSGLPIKSPELIQAILDESKQVLKTEHVMVVETHHGFVCANAGVDESNIEEGNAILLPLDPDKSAQQIQKQILEKTGKLIPILISDTFGRPFRMGQTNCAIGVAGINPIHDYRGTKDSFGKTLRVTAIAVADEICSAAELVMGKTLNCPAIIVRNYKFKNKQDTINTLIRPKNEDLFR